MATKKTTKTSATPASSADVPSRRKLIKTGLAVAGAGLVTTVMAKNARASGSWGGGGSGGGGGGGGGGRGRGRRR